MTLTAQQHPDPEPMAAPRRTRQGRSNPQKQTGREADREADRQAAGRMAAFLRKSRLGAIPPLPGAGPRSTGQC